MYVWLFGGVKQLSILGNLGVEDMLDHMKLLRIAIIDCVKSDPGPQLMEAR